MAMENNESKLKYDYFDVTADIGFYAYGKSLEEAYENAGLAMFNVITDIKNNAKNFIVLFIKKSFPRGYVRQHITTESLL